MRTLVSGLAAVLLLAGNAPTLAQELTPQALVDRAELGDILTRYYNNFGNNAEGTVGEFYAEDGEMVLGTTSYKGIDAIKGAYAAVPKDAPQKSAFALNILISNLLVTVHGDTATARLVFTETLTDKQGEAPHILTQGREFDHFVRRNGKWLIAKRQIMGANGVPDGWED
jgi:hypothetical protein